MPHSPQFTTTGVADECCFHAAVGTLIVRRGQTHPLDLLGRRADSLVLRADDTAGMPRFQPVLTYLLQELRKSGWSCRLLSDVDVPVALSSGSAPLLGITDTFSLRHTNDHGRVHNLHAICVSPARSPLPGQAHIVDSTMSSTFSGDLPCAVLGSSQGVVFHEIYELAPPDSDEPARQPGQLTAADAAMLEEELLGCGRYAGPLEIFTRIAASVDQAEWRNVEPASDSAPSPLWLWERLTWVHSANLCWALARVRSASAVPDEHAPESLIPLLRAAQQSISRVNRTLAARRGTGAVTWDQFRRLLDRCLRHVANVAWKD